MDEESRKRLTEYLGEQCGHEDREWFFVPCPKCSSRTFTSGNDMLDVKNKLVEKGEWDDFVTNSYKHRYRPPTEERDFMVWLFTMPRFAELVDEWLKGKEAKDG